MPINFNLQGQSRTASPPTAPTINTIVFGRGSHLKFAEQTMSGTKISDKDAFSRYRVAINSMAVAPTTNLLTPGVIPTTIEQFKGVPGPLTIDGNFVMDALPLRNEMFFRQLLNAPTSGGLHQAGFTATSLLTNGTLNADDSLATQPPSPLRLQVTLAAGAQRGTTPVSATNQITITINGTDYEDRTISETLIFSAADTAGAQTTEKFFKTVASDGITTNHATGASTALTGTYAVSTTLGLRPITIQSQADYRLTPGLTVEAVMGQQVGGPMAGAREKGGVPNTIVDAYLNTFSFNATREEIVTYNFGLTGKEFLQNESPDGTALALGVSDVMTGSTNTRERGTTSNQLYGGGAFATIQDDQTPMAGYNGSLYIGTGANRINFEGVLGLTLNFDNNTQFTPRLGSVQQGLPYNRQRTVGVEIELEYHSSDREFADAYLQAEDWDDVQISLTDVHDPTAPLDQRLGHRFIFDRIQITEYPSMPVESDDFIRQTIRGMALPSSNAAADAIQIQCYHREDLDDMHLAELNPGSD